MSTTSKLEEAEHKVQSLQTGLILSFLVPWMWGGPGESWVRSLTAPVPADTCCSWGPWELP